MYFYLTIALARVSNLCHEFEPRLSPLFSPSFSREIFRGAERTVENRRESCSSIKSRLSSAKTVQERGQNLFRNVCTSLDCKWMRCNTVLTASLWNIIEKHPLLRIANSFLLFLFLYSFFFFFWKFLVRIFFFFSLPSNDDFLARFRNMEQLESREHILYSFSPESDLFVRSVCLYGTVAHR